MLLIIDNYDSFTYNLAQYAGELGADLKVFRNDKITLKQAFAMKPSCIIISPGPGRPKDAGISNDMIREFAGIVPILGVCLGHQCMGEVFGANIVRAGRIMHGKTSMIYHDGKTIFKDLLNPFEATRYHSLIIERETFPNAAEAELQITAETKEGEIMGISHRRYPLFGVQFHPESILTVEGKKILANFLSINHKGRI